MKRITIIFAALSLVACGPKVKPEEPGTDPVPVETPDAPFFRLTTATGADVPETLVFNYQGNGTIENLKVETNVDGWKAECDSDWCTVSTDANSIQFSLQTYQGESSSMLPRNCKLHVSAGSTFDRTLTVGQESEDRYLYTIPGGGNYIYLPAVGTPVEIMVLSNLADWTVRNDNAWLNTEKVDHTTLRVSNIPSDSERSRYGEITLESITQGPSCVLYLQEEQPGGSGDDYTYGNGLEWD